MVSFAVMERIRKLLQAEYEYEKAQFRQESEAMGIDRKVKRGECWYPVSLGRSYYNSLNRFVVEVYRTADADADHEFEYGRTVVFFGRDGSGMLHYCNFTAVVNYVEGDRMVVVLPDEQCLARIAGIDLLGVQLSFDETTYRLMFDALSRVSNARTGRLADLRDIVHGNQAPRFLSADIPLRLPWLNASQEQAVRDVLRAKDIMVVHGPPGTGKTTTLVEAISEVLRREVQVLVCAQSNTAVDWISEQLTERGIPVLRIGNPTRVNDSMLAATYERRFESHPDYPQLWSIRRTIRQLYDTPRKGRSDSFHQKIARLRERADELEIRIRQSLFDSSRVIAATLAGSAQQVLSGQHFHTLFIDEAAQALEPACWIALQKADRVILAGDHCQLPPTVKCMEALRGGLGITMLEHICKKHPNCVRMLHVQYRMNEELMRFSSEWFYGGQLQAAPEVRHRNVLDDLDSPLVWIDTCDDRNLQDAENEPAAEAFVGTGYGRINKAEAHLTIEALCRYAERIGMQRLLDDRIDIGVISPYRAQVQYLRRLVAHEARLKPLRKWISINTVDAFQGQERDIIVVSLVRANASGDIGFLRDLRRMNVAMTRARSKLIIIGNSETLSKHRFYRLLFERCKKEVVDP